MPWVVTKNPDLEFESLQPCFYPDEDDFYLCGPDCVHPGEDIWKKFELFPTPPRSPSQAGLQNDPLSPGQETLLYYGLPVDEDLFDWASEMLPPKANLFGGSGWSTELGLSSGNLKSVIIQDCMWSGFDYPFKVFPGRNEKLDKVAGMVESGAQNHTVTPNHHRGQGEDLNNLACHCVDPSVVFSFPINKGERGRIGQAKPPISAISSTVPSNAPARNCSQPSRTSASSGDLSHSKSDGKEDNEEDDEEEEIDVMTVDESSTLSNLRSKSTTNLTSGKNLPTELILKRSALVHQQYNYMAPSSYIETEEVHPPQKKQKNETLCVVKNVVQPKAKSSSSHNYSEDSERRRNHNILERQRRNDLRSRFLTLRDHVPELVKNDKVAKVVILKKATEYVHSLQADEQRLLQEKVQLRQQQLLQKIENTRAC